MRSLRRVLLFPFLVTLASAPVVAQSGSFGNAIVVSDGELIIAEPNTNFRPGAVYIYRKSGNVWREAAQLHAPDAETPPTALARCWPARAIRSSWANGAGRCTSSRNRVRPGGPQAPSRGMA